uniref:Integrator complex subunit 4 n=1 Tax=Nothobranchius pienaari TaxID=704102 RepID=A0A1A8L2U0_9TELE
MAAHLKKRVYEEFSKVVQIPHEEAQAKKLRLSKPSKSAALHVDLCKATNSTDALQYLLQFARKPVEVESVEGVIRILLEHYYKETDNSVRLKIASLLGLLSKTNGFSPDCIVDDAINTLGNEKSHQVLAQLLDTLLVIGSQLPESPAVRLRLIEVACKHLSDTYFGVRNKCLQLLGCLGLVDAPLTKDSNGPSSSSGGARDVQSIISNYFADQDPRVRTAAIKAMLQLHDRGMKIYQIIYDQACRLLSDDYEQVRSAAVQMVWVLSQLYPESIVPIPSSNEEIRLVDDAFGKISHMVSDGSWMVRVQAAKTLGSMLQVSSHFLEQTLDKKLMSDLRRKRTAHERAKELFISGEFSSGRKWADDAPKEKLDSNTVNLIASGACGAFVHGLEDEIQGLDLLISSCEKFLQEVESFQRLFLSELPHLQDSFVDKLLELMPRLVSCKPAELVKILQTTLRQSGLLQLRLPEQIHRATATIVEPTGESDNPLKFTSGLVVALDIDATLEHLHDPQNSVKVQVLYPDGQSHVIHPKPGDFRKPGPNRHRLITQVYLSHTAWTEPSQVEVRLLLAYSSSSSCLSSPSTSKLGWSNSTDSPAPAEAAVEGTIPFSKPVKVFIMPKPTRR